MGHVVQRGWAAVGALDKTSLGLSPGSCSLHGPRQATGAQASASSPAKWKPTPYRGPWTNPVLRDSAE